MSNDLQVAVMSRKWAMPSHNTFSIKPIKDLIERYIQHGTTWADPFSRNSPESIKAYCITNDLSPEFEADYHMESLDFMGQFGTNHFDGILFDPPYSPRQISECYKGIGRQVHKEDTQSSFYGNRKKEAARIVKVGGYSISFGWNSGGIGKCNGFELVEVLLVAHGGAHNDTICTVEKKVK